MFVEHLLWAHVFMSILLALHYIVKWKVILLYPFYRWGTGSDELSNSLKVMMSCGSWDWVHIASQSGYNLNLLILNHYAFHCGFPHSSVGKESACNAGNLGSAPGLGGSPGEGNGNPLQYSCLENPMDRGAWRATVHRVARVRHDWATTHHHHHALLSQCSAFQSLDESQV